ncbi:MAG: hypothetical protein V8T12_01445 [Parabacteroides johnsonii]
MGLSYVEDFVTLLREGGQTPAHIIVYHDTGFDENGNMTYEDKDGNGVYDNSDKYIAGSPHPDFTYGINSDLMGYFLKILNFLSFCMVAKATMFIMWQKLRIMIWAWDLI